MSRRTWHRLFRSIFGSFNLRRSHIAQFQTSRLILERLEAREVPAAAINQSLVIISPDIAARVPQEELAGSRVFILDAATDAISQMGQALQANPGASVVRVISHGNSGSLLLAGQLVTGSTLQARSVEVSGWRQYLAPGADILLYGCSVASTADGQIFVNKLAQLTGADVAASTDATGAGGNVVLEYNTGTIESGLAASSRAWNHSGLTLPDVTVNYTLPGSLAGGKMNNILPGTAPANSTLKSVSVSGVKWSTTSGGYTTDLTFMVSPIATPVTGGSATGTKLSYFLGGKSAYGLISSLWNVSATNTNEWSSGSQTTLPDQTKTPTAGVSSSTPLSVNLGNQYLLVGNGYTGQSSWTGTVTVVYSVPDGDVTTTALASSLNPALAGQSVTFTATVNNTANPGSIPTGTVQFYDGTTALGSPVAVNGSGIATYTTTSFSSGPHSITAKYLGATGFASSNSAALTQTVNEAPAFTSANSGNFVVGSPVSFQFTAGGYPAPTYSVTSGTLPAGLNLASNGLLSGTPTAAGTSSFAVTATNGIGSPATQSFSAVVNQLPVFTSANTASFTNNVAGSFTATATGSPAPTFTLGQKTFFQSDFTTLPAGWTLRGSAAVTGGECVLTTATNNQNGALVLPKLGADSPGSFTASFAYTVGGGSGADGTSFNYGIVPSSTTANQNGMVTTGLAVCFIEYQNPRIEVRWNGNIIASVPNTFASTVKPVSVRLDGTGLLTVSYDSTQKLSVNLADTVNAADRANWQFAVGAATGGSNNKHAIDNLSITSNGVLPAGLTFDPTTAVISGTPTTANSAGSQVFILVATNTAGSASQLFTLSLASGAPTFTSNPVSTWVPGIAGSGQVAASSAAGAVTYGVGTTYFSSTLANAGTLPAGAAISGSALFNSNSLQLTQNVNNQNGRLQLLGLGDANPTSFSASFNYLAGGGSGADGTDFLYGPGGDPSKGLRVFLNEFNQDFVQVFYNGTSLAQVNTTIANAFKAVNITVTPQGRVRVSYDNALLLDVVLPAAYQTDDKTLWAFALAARTGGSNNFHTIKDLVIATTGVLPPGLTLDTATGAITGTLPVATAVDQFVPITATNAAGTTVQYLKLDASPSILLPGQRPASGVSAGGTLALGTTGQEFRNASAFAALTADGSVKVWGNTANGGSQADAPTGTSFVSITSTEKAFAALRADGTIVAWGFSANGATGEPTGAGFVQVFATRGAFAALKTDGSISVWGNTAQGGAASAAPTGTGFINIFASGGAFAAQKADGSIKAWGFSNAGGTGAPTGTGYTRIVANDYLSGSNSVGAFAALKPDGSIATWGAGASGGTGAPTGTGWVDIVSSSKSFAAIRDDGLIVAWGDNATGGTGEPTDTGYTQVYANPDAFVAVRQDGSLAAWGIGASGGTGAPAGTGYTTVFSSLNAFAAQKTDGSITSWGNSTSGGTGAPTGTGFNIVASSAGAFAALTNLGEIRVWGNSTSGGTGAPAGSGWAQITSTGTAFTTIKGDGTIASWGSSTAGGTGAPAGSYLTVQSPTLAAPYFPLTAGAPVSLTAYQNQTNQIFPGIRGEGLSYAVTAGALPSGLMLDPVSGWILGTAVQPGRFPITITATGPAGSVTQNYTLMVDSSLLPNQRQGAGAVYTIGSGTEIPNAGAFAGLTANGGIYAWGISSIGGSGAPTGTGYTQITSNNNAYAALKYDGSISAWGDSRYGGVGAPTGSGYTKIYSTNQAFAALKSDGSITAWGNSIQGGSGAPVTSGFTKIYAAVFSFAAQKADGSITVWGDSTYLSGNTPTGTGYTSIVPNANAYAALKADGSITAWGMSTGGGTGAPTGTGYTKIFASQNAYSALKNDGSIAVWGASERGGTNGPIGTGYVDIWSTVNGFAALKTDGSLVSWGASGTFDNAAPAGTGFTQVFSTGGSFAAMKADGSIVSWGATDSGGTGAPLGTGFTTIYTNNNAFAAMKADGSIIAWGNVSFGASGAPTGSGFTQIFSRKYAFAAMKPDGTVSVWGSSIFGGAGSSGQVAFGSIQNSTAVIPARQYGLTGNLPSARVNTPLTTQALGVNGVAGFQVGANAGLGLGSAITSGTLPNGVTLNVATGFLEGTPTASGSATFTVTTFNGTGQSSQTYTLLVQTASTTTAAPYFDPAKPIGYANYAVGQQVSYDLSAVATPSTSGSQVNYSRIAGTLPPGMVLQTTGTLTGKPTTPGNYQFTLAASDGKGITAQTFTIRVSSATPNQNIGQYSTIAAGSSGNQGLNYFAFAALRPDGTIVNWGSSAYGGAGATGVPTEAGFVQIAQTSAAFAALRFDGSIRAWGASDKGGQEAPTGTGYTRLFSNAFAFAAMKSDGSIITWGTDGSGGTGEPTGTGYTQIFTNNQAMVAMKADGSLTAWGNTANGGSGAPTGTGYVTITSNANAFAALKSDGSITAWGYTTYGGLLPTLPTNNSYTAIYSNANGFAALRGDGTITTWGATYTGDKLFPGGNNFISVTGNGGAFAALKSDGTITAWGSTTQGGSNGPTGTGFTSLYSTQSSFAGLRTDGSIVSWGSASSGGTGAPPGTGYTQIYANGSAFTALKNDGTVKSWGSANYGGTGKAPTTGGFTQVFSNLYSFVGQKADGSITVWGNSSYGGADAPTGTGLTVSSALARVPYQQYGTTGELPTAYIGTPIGNTGGAGPAAYQVGAISQGAIYQITAGALPGGLSLDPATGFLSGTPTTAGTSTFTVTTTSPVGSVSQAYTLEIKTRASVLMPGQVPGGSGLYDTGGSGQMAANSGAWGALKADGSIVTWGVAGYGGSNGPTATGYTALFSNNNAFAALRGDGKITAWGNGSSGGTGAPTGTGYTAIYSNKLAFTAIKPDGSIISWGQSTGGGGNAPTGTGYTGVVSNGGAFAALAPDGSIRAWGGTSYGGSGAPTGTNFVQIFSGYATFGALRQDGTIAVWGDSTNAALTGVPTESGFVSIIPGDKAYAAMRADGSIVSWGNTITGGINEPTSTGFTSVQSNSYSFAAMKADGSITAWGDSSTGGSGAPTGTGFVSISAGQNAYAAMKADGSITAWGSSTLGGAGAPTSTGWTKIVTGKWAMAALRNDGSIAAWGSSITGGSGAPTGTGFTQIYATGQGFAALKADGSAVSWGGLAATPTATGLVALQSPQAQKPVFSISTLPATKTNQAYWQNLGVNGVGNRYEITVGTLPAGMTLDATTGVISGTATALGSFPFILSASNPTGTASQPFNLVVNSSPPVFTNVNRATFTAGTAGTFTVAATNATSYSVTSGTLPNGLTLNSATGVISGTAASGGLTYLAITASNSIGSEVQPFTLTVNQAPSITSVAATTFVAGSKATFAVQATGFPVATFSTSGTLPNGVSFDSATGVLSGTPASNATGTFTFTISASNGVGSAVTQSFTLVVTGAPAVTSFNPSNARGGSTIIISGQRFTGATLVAFAGGKTAVPTVISDLEISVVVPVGAVTGPVSVTAPAGTGTSSISFVVDNVPAPLMTAISTDTGSSATDLITSDNDLAISGTAEAYAIINVYSGSTFVGTTTASGSGAWTLSSTGSLAEGTRALTATATDSAGNISAVSATYNVVVDSTAPLAPTISTTITTDTGASATDLITSDNDLAISGTAEADATVTVYDGSTLIGTVTADGSGAWALASTGTLTPGTHFISAKATDLAGNVSAASSKLTVDIDTTAPNAPTVLSALGASAVVTPGYSKDATLVLSGSAEAGSRVELFEGENSLGTATANPQGLWSLNSGALAEGTYYFTAKASDLAGNVSAASSSISVIVDLTAPDSPTLSAPSTTNNLEPTLYGLAEPYSNVAVTINSKAYITSTDGLGNWSLNLAANGIALTNGTNSVGLAATDKAGNVSQSVTSTIIVDTIAPVVVFDPVTGNDRISKTELAATVTLSGTTEAGTGITVTIGSASPAFATVVGSTWSYTLSPSEINAIGLLSNVSIVVTGTDPAGNITTRNRTVSISNVVAPGTPKLLAADDTGLPDNITSKQTVRIDVGGLANVAVGNLLRLVDGAGATLAEFTLDAATIALGTHQFTLGAVGNLLDEGTYAISAVTVDTSINDKATSAGSLALTIDNRIPGAPSTPNLLAAHDTGASNTDNLTNKNASLSFEIKLPDQVPFAAKGDTLRLYRDLTNNGPTLDDTIAASVVLASLTSPQTLTMNSTALSNGSYFFYSRVFIAATSNLGLASNRIEIVIDTVAPNAPGAPVLLAADDSGNSNSDNTTLVELPRITVSLSGTGAVAGDRVDITRGSTVLGGVELTAADITANSIEIQIDQALTQGTNALVARLTDRAGNTVNSGSTTIILDTIQPGAATIALDAASDTGASNSDNLTHDTTPTFSGTAEAGAIVDLFDVTNNVVVGAAVVADSSGKWTITVAPVLAQGSYTLVARVTDPAGNAGADSAKIQLTIDTTAPVAPAVDLRDADDTGVSDSDNNTNATVLTLSGSTDSFALVELFDGSTSLGTTTADSKGAWTFVTATLTDATHAFSATSTDTAGNTSSAGTVLSVVVDTATPGTPSGITLADDTGSSNSDNITSDTTITVAGTTDANATVVLVDAQNRSVSTTANGSGAFTLTTAALADGAQALVLKVTDVAGNTNAGTTINLTVDTAAPVPVLSSTSANLVNGAFSVTVTFPEDVTGFDSTDVTLTNGTLSNFVAVSATVYIFDVTPATDGAVTVSVAVGAADDTAGNSSLASNTLARTFDGTAPTVTTFSTTAADPTNAPFTVNVVFSEIVTGFVASDVTVTNGTVSNFTGQGQNYSFTVTPTADGATTVKLLQGVASDPAGNTSTASSTITRTYDSTLPTVTLSTSAPDPTNAAFTVTATFSESVTGFGLNDLTVVNGTASGLTGSGTTYSFLVTPTVDGTVSITVLAAATTDAATNASTASSTLSRVYDATAPGLPVISNTIVTDSGSSSTDRITNDDDLQLTGTAEANASVDVYDGLTLLGSVTADGSGNWTLASTGTLAPGLHAFTAKATDAAGNTGNGSLPLMVTIDTTRPNAPTIDLLAADDTGSSDSDNKTKATTLRLTGTTEAFAVIEVFSGNTSLGTTTADAVGIWQFTTGTLSDATYAFKAEATDIAGNTSASKSSALSVVVDLTAPSDPGSVTPTSTSNPGDTLNGTAEANAKVLLSIGGNTYSTTADGTGAWSLNLSANGVALVSGNNTIGLQAIDVAGNSSAGSATATVNYTPPNMRLDAGSDTGRSNADGITSNTTPSLTGTTGAGFGVVLYEIISGNRVAVRSTTADGSGNWSISTSTLAEGTHTFVANITPVPSGSAFDSDQISIIVDTTDPLPPATSLMAADDTGSSDTDKLTNKTALRLFGTSEPFALIQVLDGSTVLGSVIADASGNWMYLTGTLAAGAHSFSAKATDIAGNDPPGAALTVTIDVVAPVAPTNVAITTDTGISNDFNTSDDTIVVSGVTEPGATVLLTDDINRSVSTIADATTGAFTLSNAALADGTHALKLTITDTSGNTNTGYTFNVTVDTVSPTVILSTNAADPTNLNPFTVTATFSETVTGLTLGDITVTNGTASNLSGSGSTYTFDVVPTADGKIEVSIGANAANDIAANSSLASNTLVRVYDGTAPSVALTTSATPATKAPFTVTATFSEDVAGLAVGDITATNGATIGSFTAVSATVYTFVVTPTAQGQVDVSIATGMAIDAASNGNVVSNTLSRIYDTVAPGVTLSSSAGNPTNAAFSVTATFSESVSGFDLGDLILTNATASTLAGSGTTYTILITPITDGTVSVDVKDVAALDAAGNANTASNSLTRVIETVRPSVVLTSTDPARVNAPFTVTATYSEPVTGLSAANITATNGATIGSLTGSGSVYTFVVTPTAQGQVDVSIGAGVSSDAATNLNTASNTLDRLFDDVQPIPTIKIGAFNSASNSYSAKVSFNEPVSGFDLSDLKLSNLTAQNLEVSGNDYSFELLLTRNFNNTISVVAGAATDEAGNSSVGSATETILADTSAPTGTLSASRSFVNIANRNTPVSFTVTLTDLPAVTLGPVSGIDLSSFPAALKTSNPNIKAVLVSKAITPLATIGSATTKASATYEISQPATTNGWMDFTGTTVSVTLDFNFFSDVSGNIGANSASVSFDVDVVAPELVLATRTTPVANSQEFKTVDLLFSEPVNGVTATSFGLQRTTNAGKVNVSLGLPSVQPLSGTSAFTVTGITQSQTAPGGDYAFFIPLTTSIVDKAGNKAVLSSSVGPWTQVDPDARPRITSSLPNLTNNPILPITVTFGRAMKNLTAAGIVVLDANNQAVPVAISSITRSADGKQFTFTVDLGSNAPAGTVRNFTIKVADGAAVSDDAFELPSGFSQEMEFTIDQQPPTAQLIAWPSQFVDGGKTNLASIDFKAIFDQPVLNLPRNMITVTGGGTVTSVFAIAGTGLKEWRVTVSPALVGTGTLNVAARLNAGIVRDLAGNANLPSNTVSVAIKRNLALTSTINVGTNLATGYKFAVGKLNNLRVRFSDVIDPSTITAAAFNVVGGTVTNIRPDADNMGAQFDLVFANLPYSQFTMSVAIKAGVVRDLFGNTALTSVAKAWTIDGLPPTATMSGASRIRLGESATVAIRFTQMVQPLNLSMFDVTFTPLNGATVTVSNTALSLRGAGASWSISHKSAVRGTLTVRLKIDAAGPKDLLGNALQVPVGYQVVIA